MNEHLDLDALADVLAGVSAPDHLDGCAGCHNRLAQLQAALPGVSASLAALTLPAEPADLAQRLTDALRAERRPGGATVVPLGRRQRARWLPALAGVAAAAALVVGAVVLVQRPGTTTDQGGPGYALSSTGADYARDGKALTAALPALLEGNASPAPEAAPLGDSRAASPAPTASLEKQLATGASGRGLSKVDPLARLRTDAGLAACLVALADPADTGTGLPLAVDYASFEGKPALVVVLPTGKKDKVDVFVVGATCNQADATLLFFTRLATP